MGHMTSGLGGLAPFFYEVFATVERIYSVFSALFQPSLASSERFFTVSKWVELLRFHQPGKSKCHAAARVGINPTPTVAECCNHFDNSLIAKVLYTSAVGTGFIPVLPTAAAARRNAPTYSYIDRIYPLQGEGFMPSLKKCPNRCEKTLPREGK